MSWQTTNWWGFSFSETKAFLRAARNKKLPQPGHQVGVMLVLKSFMLNDKCLDKL